MLRALALAALGVTASAVVLPRTARLDLTTARAAPADKLSTVVRLPAGVDWEDVNGPKVPAVLERSPYVTAPLLLLLLD